MVRLSLQQQFAILERLNYDDYLWVKLMTQQVVLNLPDGLVQQGHEVATFTQRALEEVLLEWLDRGRSETRIGRLPDDQVLAICDSQMTEIDQERMGELLERQREGLLLDGEIELLDDLLSVYQQGMIRKAEALKVAIDRGLRARLT